jgi:hypothetical protein
LGITYNPYYTQACIATPLAHHQHARQNANPTELTSMITLHITPKQVARISITVLALVVLTTALWPTGHSAGLNNPVKWSVAAIACTPNGDTARGGMIDSTHGNVRFAEGRTGTAYLMCPFTDGSLDGQSVSVIGMSITGLGGARAAASLRMVDLANGDVTDAFVTSTDQACLGTSVTRYFECTGGGSHQIDFSRYYYYVQISITRSSANDNVRVTGVSIY